MIFWVLCTVCAAIGLLIFSLQFGWWRASVSQVHARVLMYHMINYPKKKAKFNKLRVSPRSFQKQVRYLKDKGYQFIFMSELAESEENCVALTFDDGYRDNLVHADKILEEVGGKATLYLVCDRHGRDWSVTKKAKHNSGELRDEEKLSDNDVKTMLSNGRWELGAHTVTHAHLPSIDHADLYREITRSKEILEKTFDVNVKSFAYPFGIYSDRDVQAVRDAGFETACTTREGISERCTRDPLELSRVKVRGGESMLSFRVRLRTGRRK